MRLTHEQLDKLTHNTKEELLFILYKIEDELEYKCKSVSRAIDYLQGGNE